MRILIAACILVVLFVPLGAWGKIGGGDITFHPEGASAVVYSHDLHVAKLGLKCNNCHYQIYKMSVQANRSATMAEMQKGESCGTCHNGKKAFDVKTNCTRCHGSK